MFPLSSFLTRWLSDYSDEWGELLEGLEPGEADETRLERETADELEDPATPSIAPVEYPVEDLYDEAAGVKYPSGKVKRTRFRPVNLAKRRVIVVLHQMGVERKDSSRRWKYTTASRVITPLGRRLRLHPVRTRLVEANAFDRRPFHGIGFEIAGNFEETDGDRQWYKPDKFGRGRMGEAQIIACRQEIAAVVDEVNAIPGVVVEGIAPHRVSGRNKRGRPNRPLCPGSRAWSMCGEWAARELGLAIPGPDFKLGGLTIPDRWHGPYWQGGEGLRFL